ncbi:glycosyltransferase family 1 protein [Candidatus Falkowbacteria bacterium CG10_big_fil_rev_8_21_14_0_10_37_14]|uniref:Glycosyltransferase family 1 protein n=1 Tax=Candidatus Falkowbacteria bacterium CG10_big_fil_rev_8_21_14_0_10_37_14 TaxID=1974561 RepID=A0A2M6WSJ5_9BACT|nr:glycosyltransferase family 4 protein [Candidatus Falkowbacteria bacterium]PIT95744.1 MAG: glycosyltransferase family 1 protein [Candidatus Falkowbacteria bacterium CG10_big_fil_rev_8_21_14_0_10_37_14]
MKVLLVNKFNFVKGGADKYFLDLAGWLSAEPNIEVAKFCMRHPDNFPDKYSKYFVSQVNYSKISFHEKLRSAMRLLWSTEAARQFEKLLKDFKPDVIHIHNIYHQISPSILPIAKAHGIPVVMHIHDYKLVCPNYKMFTNGQIDESCKSKNYWRCVVNRCVKNSFLKSALVALEMSLHHSWLKVYEKNIDLYLSPSKFVKEKLGEWGWPKEQIKVVPHCIEAYKYKPSYTLGDYFLFFGRLDTEKGVDLLLKAFKQAKQQKLKLKIVGSGPERKNLTNLVKELSLQNRVEFIGPKHSDELNKIIRGAYTVVVPSRWYEVFGLVNLEAAVLGKLVIAADIGGIPEVISNGHSGLLFKANSVDDLATKLDWCAHNPGQVEDFAREARRYVETNFSQSKHIAKILAIYKDLVDKK